MNRISSKNIFSSLNQSLRDSDLTTHAIKLLHLSGFLCVRDAVVTNHCMLEYYNLHTLFYSLSSLIAFDFCKMLSILSFYHVFFA